MGYMATADEPGYEFDYITKPVYSHVVSPSLINKLNKPNAESKTWPKVAESDIEPKESVEVRVIRDPSHPACGQSAMFAIRDLEPADLILFYLGRVHLNESEDTDSTSDYDLSFDRELGLSIDAQLMGNEARFMNDYRGVADGPNAEFKDCWVRLDESNLSGASTTRGWERRVGIFVLGKGKAKRKKGIKRGEEILVNYGRTFWSERNGGMQT